MRITNRLENLEGKFAHLLTDCHEMEDMGNFILHVLNPNKGVEYENVRTTFEDILTNVYPRVNITTFYEMYTVDWKAYKLIPGTKIG